MAIPKFNDYGVLPKGIYDCTIEEVYERFGSMNNYRKKRWEKFLLYFKKLKNAKVAEAIIIDGSFVTDKSNPGDIDIVVHLKPEMLKINANDILKDLFDRVNNTLVYRIEVFPHFKNHDAFKNDFSEYFQYIRPNVAKKRGMVNSIDHNRNYHKGIVRVNL